MPEITDPDRFDEYDPGPPRENNPVGRGDPLPDYIAKGIEQRKAAEAEAKAATEDRRADEGRWK